MPDPIIADASTPPRLNKPFLWADYIELRCLIHPDKVFTRADIDDVYVEMQDHLRDNEVKGEIDSVVTDRAISFEADKADARSRKWGDCFRTIARRVKQYGPDYPFVFDKTVSKVSLKDNPTPGQKYYLLSLLASSLRYCPETRRGEVAEAFELASYFVFRRLMPNGARIYMFGAGNARRSRYKGHLFTRLKKLTRDFRGAHKLRRKDFGRVDFGDGGVDLLAWHPLEDGRDGIPLALAQCGCSPEDWVSKQLEASPSKLGRHLLVAHPWACYYFMPHDLMDREGDWYRAHDLGKAIIVDRVRMVRLSRKYGAFEEAIGTATFLDEAMALKMS